MWFRAKTFLYILTILCYRHSGTYTPWWRGTLALTWQYGHCTDNLHTWCGNLWWIGPHQQSSSLFSSSVPPSPRKAERNTAIHYFQKNNNCTCYWNIISRMPKREREYSSVCIPPSSIFFKYLTHQSRCSCSSCIVEIKGSTKCKYSCKVKKISVYLLYL